MCRTLAVLVALVAGAGCAGGGAGGGDPVAPRCLPADGAPRTPGSIVEVAALVGALPRPVTVPCFLESLQRPLQAHANRSVFSFQPALGSRSPRVFLFLGERLIATVVPEGKGSELVELGEFVEPRRTLKAEVKFPVEAELAAAAPFQRVRDGSGTSCRACHFGEEQAADIDYAEAFVSAALRPDDRSVVDVDLLRRERAACDETAEPARCAFLRALFDHGEVRAREFPADLPTILR